MINELAIEVSLGMWLVFAWFSGTVEGSVTEHRIRTNDRRKLNHKALTALRAGVLLLIWWVALPFTLKAAPLVWAFIGSFSLVHRVPYNLTRGKPIDYMGSDLRMKDDASYDTFWWSITSYKHDHGRKTVTYRVRRAWYPWAAASAFELLLIVIGITIHILTIA